SKFGAIQEATIAIFGAPPVDGLGNTGGFKLQLQDRGDSGLPALQESVDNVVNAGNSQPGLVGLFSSFRANQPQVYVDLDRSQAKATNTRLMNFSAHLKVYPAPPYTNDSTLFGVTWQVNVQPEPRFGLQQKDIGRLKVRNPAGPMAPIGALFSVKDPPGPAI